jgi:chorismate mutase-like protein
MPVTSFDLGELRQRLNAIDDRLHDLLIERAETISLVAEHKRSNRLAFYQPGREAEILRRLAARHRGPLAVASLVRIWREILAAGVNLEAPFAVAVYAPGGAPGLWDLARDHYGCVTPISAHGSTGQVIGSVAEARASAGVLPLPRDGDPDPWWRHLVSANRDAPRVIARLPFGPCGNAADGAAGALVIGHGPQQPTGLDRTLIAVETAGIARDPILDLLTALDLGCRFVAACDRSAGTVMLVELDGFVPLSDPRLERFRRQLGAALHRLLPLGGYAVPLSGAPAVTARPGGG